MAASVRNGIKTLGGIFFLSLVGLSSLQNVQAQTTINICDRTPRIETDILQALGKTGADCGSVTAAELAGIRTLSVRNSGITALKDGDFDNLTSLKRLDLQKHNLSSLPAGLFDNLTSLEQLDLYTNRLSSLPAGVFDNLANPERLSLYAWQSLSSLPAGVFDKLTNLERLNLGSWRLSSLPAGVFDKLTNLERLNLGSRSLSSLPAGVFDKLTNLEWLDLSNSRPLSSLPAGVFDKLTNLELLNLSYNNLSSLPAGVFDKLTSLRTLYLHRNNLSSLPAGVFDKLTSLRTLYLHRNNLSSLQPGVFDKIPRLLLDLRHNGLTCLPYLPPSGGWVNLDKPKRDYRSCGVLITEFGGGTTQVSEASTDTYTVVLDGEPRASVTIKVTSGNPGAATVSPATLTFTPTNWNVEQWVTVTGVDDSVDQSSDRSVTISHSAISRDASYNRIAIAAVPVTVVDNDSAGVSVMASNGSTAVTEAAGAGRTDTYTVVLDTEPRVSVTIEVTSGDEGAAIVSPATLTFTPANWNRMQTVTVTGVDDSVDQGSDRSVAISHTATSRDASYNRIAIAAVLVTVVDNDGAGVSVMASNGSTAVTEAAGAGRTDTYTVMLNTRPTSNVDIAVLSSDEGAATVSPATLIFTPANWNRMQTVTVTGVDDSVDQGNRSVTITHTASSSDANYRTISIPSVVATVADNDTAAVTIAESGDISVTEATGADHTATYTVVLATLPSASVEIAIESDDPGAATVSPATLTFAPANWNRMQTVTVTGVDDSVDQGNRSVTITHTASSSDASYRTISIPSVVATVVDNDTAAVTITESGDISVTEATGADHTATYTVVLATLPSASVEVAIESDDPGAATVSPATLTFAPTNWNRMQTVTVTGVNDNVDQQVNRSATIGHSSVSYDPAYDGISIPSVSVTVVAADSVAKEAKEAWHLRLGRTVSHQVVDALQDRLAARPAAGLQVTVAGEAITDTPPLVENQGILSKAMGFEVVSPEALVEGSSFSFAPEGTEGGPQVALWGQGALSSFRGEQDTSPWMGT